MAEQSSQFPGSQRHPSDEHAVTAEWLRLTVPAKWSVRDAAASPVAGSHSAAEGRWSRAASITAAPFPLPDDLYGHKSVATIPEGSYQITVSAFRMSRNGASRGPVRLKLSTSDRVEPPPFGVGMQFVRKQKLGDRTFTAAISMDRSTDVEEGLNAANEVLEGLLTLE